MSKQSFSIRSFGLCLVLFAALGLATASAQTTQFTYQGRLTDNSLPANGSYDFQFKLFDALAGGSQIGGTLSPTNVTVTNGIFTVTLDFGAAAFPGANRWLDISVRLAGGGGFTTLSPRQPITSTPYSIKSLSAASAASADGLSAACVNCVTSGQIGSVLGSQVSGAIPVASVPAGSGSYIQNTTSPQAGANFNIDGNGTVGGTLSGNIVNATTQFNLNGSRLLSAAGTNNFFAGIGAGTSNGIGTNNSFFGPLAGNLNTAGIGNSLFGWSAGFSNTTGSYNSFFGNVAGYFNLTGNSNSFFGSNAGQNNTTGAGNNFFGESAGLTNTTGTGNSYFGTSSGNGNLTGDYNSFFGQASSASSPAGKRNVMLGALAQFRATPATSTGAVGGDENIFIGFQAGGAATRRHAAAIGTNAFVGCDDCMVLGNSAVPAFKVGIGTSTPTSKLTVAGLIETTSAGVKFPDGTTQTTAATGTVTNVTASLPLASSGGVIPNISLAGIVPVVNGGTGLSSAGAAGRYLRSDGTNWNSSFLQAADLPGGSGNYIQNTAAQQAAANFNISGSGTAGGTLSANLVNTATQYNLGGNRVLFAAGFDNVFAGIAAGLNNTTGLGNSFFGGEAGRSNTTGDNNSFYGRQAGIANNTGFNNSFFGSGAGSANSTASWNTFVGHNAGTSTTTGNFNAFFGDSAGFANTTASYNSFFGAQAGQNNTLGYDNVFIGDLAGFNNTTGNNNTLVGDTADVTASNLTHATAIGAEATVSTSNTIVLGRSNGSDKVRIPGLSAATATHLCINTANQNELSLCSSSLRYKKNVAPLRAGLGLVLRLRPVTFAWKETGEGDLGLIAEEVAAVDPLLVTHNPAGEIQGVKYDQLNVLLINAIKQQQEQIKLQQKEIETLKRLVCQDHPKADVCRATAAPASTESTTPRRSNQ